MAIAAMLAVSCREKPAEEVKPSPKLLSLIPKAGYPGTEVIISGYGFEDPATVSVEWLQ